MDETLYPPVHPGEILRDEFLTPLGISAYRLAQATGLSQTHLGQILRGRRSITPHAALRLSKALGLSERYWLTAQNGYDIEVERSRDAAALAEVTVLVGAA
ncbi:HigA family addiction module antitoxin [Cellulomonas triticagri]|uniref:Addiction module antidote protein, HigA family n=1 Tax=Cellulomonas triticagri TaxID=2483352 RepID=A0A3M2JTR4_9CELL|nr:HigA family addiction module antitoxin [Cellulomonas triticagri]RMI14135.1 addiction module antidote protein, HigA family [Cellulomonas triticagri]